MILLHLWVFPRDEAPKHLQWICLKHDHLCGRLTRKYVVEVRQIQQWRRTKQHVFFYHPSDSLQHSNRSETDCGGRRGRARLLLRRFAFTSASLCSVHLNITTQFFFKHVLFSCFLWVQLSQADTWTDRRPSRCKTDAHSVAFFDWNENK